MCNISVLEPFRQIKFQLFRVWFAEACVRSGICLKKDLKLSWNVKLVLGKIGACFSVFRRQRLLVCSGGKPEYYAWPWCYFYEIIPVVWDCWPECENALVRFVRRNRVRTIFCTASQTVTMVRKNCPHVNAVWLPEGIDVSYYPMGKPLANRSIDVLELGRNMPSVHQDLLAHSFARGIKHLFQKDKIIFSDNESMIRGMQDAKISVCFPQSMTNPEHAGNIETMTQRYWEFMLTGALIVGHAPRELVEFCGYNPVVELGEHPAKQIEEILSHIEDYQDFVDKNRKFAEVHGSWDSRMSIIMEHLK